MNVPISELQQYKGQWYCPICLAEIRAADNRPKRRTMKDAPITPYAYDEVCDRCGRKLTTVYLLNGRKLCADCLKHEQDKWTLVSGEKPGATQFKVSLERRKKSKLRRLLEHFFSEFLGLLGIRWEPESDDVVPFPVKRKEKFSRQLMSEGRMKAEVKPETEGIMKEDIVPSAEYSKKGRKKEKGSKGKSKKKGKSRKKGKKDRKSEE